MSMMLSNLCVLAYANNFTLWHYKTECKDITKPNYFNQAADMMNIGDLFIANIDIGGSPSTQFYRIADNTKGVVSIASY